MRCLPGPRGSADRSRATRPPARRARATIRLSTPSTTQANRRRSRERCQYRAKGWRLIHTQQDLFGTGLTFFWVRCVREDELGQLGTLGVPRLKADAVITYVRAPVVYV